MSKVFFFGYGSLMYPSGVNGRGMLHHYTKRDLFPAELVGFKRGMIAGYGEWLFYGINEDKDAEMNGTIMPIHDEYDLHALLRNEGALNYKNPMYIVEDVTDRVTSHRIDTGNTKILTLVNRRKDRGTPYPGYCENVFKGIQYHGREFIDKFLETGGCKKGKIHGINMYRWTG